MWCCTYDWVMSHMIESWHIWLSHVSVTDTINMHNLSHCDSFICATRLWSRWLMWVMLHIWISHEDSFVSATWLIYMCDITHTSSLNIWMSRRDSIICATWRIYMCNITHAYVRHDSFICVTWLVHVPAKFKSMQRTDILGDTTHSYVWHDAFICVTWLIHMCGMTHSYVRHDSFVGVTRHIWHDLCDTHKWVLPHL